MSGSPEAIPDETPVHRVGGGTVENLALKPAEATLNPPGISMLRGGTASEAAEAMRRQFPRMAPRGQTVVGTTTAGQIREAGFDVIMNPTRRFPQHARLIHPAGAAGFTQENLQRLAERFHNQGGF
ncbi:MAG TPA: hypothetical protein VJ739_12720 [Gemmataceae bacterium]|nr:hypothetical protein [Gemmataceae bacterium]